MSATRPSASRGVTLVELVVFIVIVGVAMAGVFAAFNTMTAASADPQLRKQVLSVAESLMEEIQLMPFTYCDPDDPNAATATGSASCTGGTDGANDENALAAGVLRGPELAGSVGGAETRGTYDNVSDYNGFSMSPITNIEGITVTGLENYSASVVIVRAGTELGLASSAQALRITVTATHVPSGTQVVLEGYRTRYAPTILP